MVTPPSLQPGDTVGIAATARKITKAELQPALDLLTQWGLVAVLGHTIGAEAHQFAGDDTLRTQDFQAMLDNPNIKAIWCARGGYGTVRMLDGLDFTLFKQHPKWIVGYSDITVLHSHIHTLGIETLHAQMPLEVDKKTLSTRESIYETLFGRKGDILMEKKHSLNRNGTANGLLVGGNLSVLYSLCGSSSALNTAGKVLFLEDLDEYLYHIDRMMQNLKRNGMLENLAGLVIGGMTQMHDNSIPFGQNAEEIIRAAVEGYEYPVCFNFPAGHTRDNRALVLGRQVELMVSHDQVTLRF
ncbi:MAG: LD-carboxypeptidase [Bacteroidota bacterium]